ncbi:hypothetical protein GE061_019437 [Apolygus lucorum]|uniref:G-protein coupled receptors family 1 profile domain-containing protein n=1 Tax=Apolygus lucorum TaxID=248454 RepID=A0A8S9XAE1_APOLU|nr:hypothetical protein GE061_019437 [Apolygus lucorum]
MAADFATTISLVNGTDVGTPGLLTEYEQCIQNKYPNTSYEWEKEYEYVSYGVLLNAIGLLGILGNILSTMALIRPKSRINSFNYLLLCLVSWDTVLIVLSISLFGIPVFSDSGQPFFEYYFHTIYPILTPKVLYPVACIAQTSILFLTLTITLERFVAISYPMKAKSICTTGRTHMIVMCVILFSIIYNIPRFFEFTTIHKYDELSNKTILQIEWTELRCNHNYISFYINWLSLCFLSLLPFSILAVLNTSIYLKGCKGLVACDFWLSAGVRLDGTSLWFVFPHDRLSFRRSLGIFSGSLMCFFRD